MQPEYNQVRTNTLKFQHGKNIQDTDTVILGSYIQCMVMRGNTGFHWDERWGGVMKLGGVKIGEREQETVMKN